MGTLIFVCRPGHQVSTGVEVDRSSYKRLPRTKTAIFCPRCHKNHLLSSIWAWLDSNVPEARVTSDKSAAQPHKTGVVTAMLVMCYCITSGHIASTPRLAERCSRLSAGVSLPARARRNALRRPIRGFERTPFFWRHYVRLFTFFFSTR